MKKKSKKKKKWQTYLYIGLVARLYKYHQIQQ